MAAFREDGTLHVLSEDEPKRTVQFHIPAKRHTDLEGRITTYTLTWIHPDFNEQFCHYYAERPGDSPNFYVTEDTTELGQNDIDLETVDDLLAWLGALRVADVS